MKLVLVTPNISAGEITGLRYDPDTMTLVFKHGEREYCARVEESLTTYVKVYTTDEIEIINNEALL